MSKSPKTALLALTAAATITFAVPAADAKDGDITIDNGPNATCVKIEGHPIQSAGLTCFVTACRWVCKATGIHRHAARRPRSRPLHAGHDPHSGRYLVRRIGRRRFGSGRIVRRRHGRWKRRLGRIVGRLRKRRFRKRWFRRGRQRRFGKRLGRRTHGRVRRRGYGRQLDVRHRQRPEAALPLGPIGSNPTLGAITRRR